MGTGEERQGDVDVVGIGPVTWDRFLIVPRPPSPNERVKAIRISEGTGGSAATLLAALRRWKVRGRLVSTIGFDELSQKILDDLTREGVEIDGLVRAEDVEGLSHTIIVDNRNGTRLVIEAPSGSGLSILRAEAMRDWWFENARVLHMEAISDPCARHAVDMARAHGLKIIASLHDHLDVLGTDLLRQADWLIADSHVAAEVTKELEPSRAAYALHLMFDVPAIVTCGRQGAYFVQGRETIHQPAINVPVVDRTGAGALFVAGFIYSVLSAWDIMRSLRVASWVAAMGCREIGNRKGIPTEMQLKQFLYEE